ncbi:3664_t:CDS:2, partial [Acaulospora morrowiae]
KNDKEVEVQAFDHWSLDTKQNAWFTVSSFDAVFETLNPKPEWIKVFSDNGGHYHSFEIMAVVSNWYQWYTIEVKDWYFFEAGEAKSLVDSHHAAILHAIARYVRVGRDLDSGKKIQEAIQDLGGTRVAHIEPLRDHVVVKTIKEITSFSHWKWPINGENAGFILARALPNIGEWRLFSPTDVSKLTEKKIKKPNPNISTYTKPSKEWIVSILQES